MTSSRLENWLEASLRKHGAAPDPAYGLLAKLTVVIPSYERQDFLLRQCAYWHASGAAVVIVDGSRKALDGRVRELVNGLADIRYLHCADGIMKRLKLASTCISTPYAIFQGDDEFLLFTGLCSAIARLEQDASLGACIGQSLAFYPSLDGASCSYGEGYPHWRYSIEQDDVKQRLNAALANYTAATCYAVLRTPIWQQAWGQLKNWSSPYAAEIQQSLATYARGKLTTVDEVYWMRSNENKPITNRSFNRGLSFQEWWHSGKNKVEQDDFIAALVADLTNLHPISQAEANACVNEAIGLFVSHSNEIDRKNAETAVGLGAALHGLRRTTVAIAKWLLPASLTEHLKSRLFQWRSNAAQGELGSLSNLQSTPAGRRFMLNETTVRELTAMEALISSFHHARSARSG